MGTKYPDSPNKNAYQEGLEFQDFVVVTLAECFGLVLSVFSSRKYQYDRGETLQGVEIKLDKRCTETGRLSIEIAEKTRADKETWTPSGVYRKDNTWLYIQGNYERIYIFFKKFLRLLHRSGNMEEHMEPTIRAFYLPFAQADNYGFRVIPPENDYAQAPCD